ncbi:hypothetical protein [Gluconobacter cerinus]|uniref:hypothetical protein n=1 Tax=Gluconobacter cerinus TaxID=38307 RepID=UPI001FFC734F|nr:hypothetical protein [Gluconobacter cerinus]
MGHNYAKPLTSQVRMERVLSRLPEDWSVRIEREPGKGWRAWMQPPTHSGQWSEVSRTMIWLMRWRKCGAQSDKS